MPHSTNLTILRIHSTPFLSPPRRTSVRPVQHSSPPFHATHPPPSTTQLMNVSSLSSRSNQPRPQPPTSTSTSAPGVIRPKKFKKNNARLVQLRSPSPSGHAQNAFVPCENMPVCVQYQTPLLGCIRKRIGSDVAVPAVQKVASMTVLAGPRFVESSSLELPRKLQLSVP
jgi:hypothetical protein